MKASINYKGKELQVDFSKPLDISIPIKEGDSNPNCYWADNVEFETIRMGSFVGSVAEGGTVNYQKLHMTPHGNGTHTECYGHITDSKITIGQALDSFHFVCQLVTLTPEQINGDQVITFESFREVWESKDVNAVIIRTAPNTDNKLTRKYSGTNPPFLDHKITQFLKENGVEHLLVDLPSVDKEIDEGKLLAHHAFFNTPNAPRTNASITELIYVDNLIDDGFYLLNLQILNLEMDASPSRPVLYKITGF